MRLANIERPNACCEAKACSVGQRDDLVFIIKGDDRQHRTEYFVLRNIAPGADSPEKSRGVEIYPPKNTPREPRLPQRASRHEPLGRLHRWPGAPLTRPCRVAPSLPPAPFASRDRGGCPSSYFFTAH